MSEWANGTLADAIASLDAGVSVNAEDRPHGAGEIGVLKTSAISGGAFRAEQNKTVLQHERRLVAEPVEADSILVSRMNTPALVGEACYVHEAHPTLFLPDRLWQLKPKDRAQLNMRWLSFVLQSADYRRYVEVHATGTSGSMKNLPKSKLLALPVQYPAAAEQSVIAQILDALDTAIHETEALIDKLKIVKQGLLHDLLTRGIDANGQLRPPQNEAPQLYKESPLGWIPMEWEVDCGKNVCREIVVGIVIKPTQYYRESGVAVLRSANVRETGLTLDNLVFMSPKDHRNLSKSAVGKGDVLTVRTGYPGTSCVVDDQIKGANCVDIIISRPLPDLEPSYWSTWINSDFGKKQVLAVQGGLAQQHFNVGDLMKLMVKMPPITEQKAISDQLRGVLSRIDVESKEQSKLFALKAALMDDLLTGRVRVTPLLESMQQAAAPTGA